MSATTPPPAPGAAAIPVANGTLFVISAPSGAGKSTLVGRLVKAVPGLVFSVSWTTRAPRPGEVDGVAYHFTDETAFRQKVARGEMLEWAGVHDRLYGTGRAETLAALSAGIDVILDIDVQGAAQVREAGLPATLIFVMPPSYEALVARLASRSTETEDERRLRLRNAAREIRQWPLFDYLVVNDDLDAAADELIAIVRAARARLAARTAQAETIVAGFPAPPGEAGR